VAVFSIQRTANCNEGRLVGSAGKCYLQRTRLVRRSSGRRGSASRPDDVERRRPWESYLGLSSG
jgi:hypothetical protein